MLFGIIGTTWVISIMAGVFLLGYVGHLHHHARLSELPTDYVWDGLRLLMLVCFALALFYAGVAFQLVREPMTPLQRIFMVRTITPWTELWTADRWGMLALGFAAIGVACALLQLGDEPHLSMPRLSRPRRARPLRRAENPLAPLRQPGFVQRRWRRLVAASLGVGLTLFLWWGISRVNLGEVLLGDFENVRLDGGLSTLLPADRARPTPTTEALSPALAVAASENPALAGDAPVVPLVIPTPTPQVETASLSITLTSDADTTQDDGDNSTPSSANVLDAIVAVEPTALTNLPDVLINNPAGVNARAEPDLSAQVVTILPQGARVPAMGRSLDDQWYQVRLPDGQDAWVAAFVVELSSDTLPLANDTNAEAALAAAQPESTPATTVSTTTNSEEIQAAALSVASPVGAAESTSYSVELLSPSEGTSGQGLTTFVWEAGFEPAENQGLEVIFWRPGESPLDAGFRVAAPTSRGQAVVNLSDLSRAVNGALEPGPYRWGVMLIQQTPYRRLALLSQERTFILVE